MKYNCIIVDDEPIAIQIISGYLNHFQDFNVVCECKNAIEAMEVLKKKKIDLIFLDIQMPQINGIQFLQSVNHCPKVIFTTAYRDYAVEGYQFDAIDYLLKPISFERFVKAIDKFYNYAISTSLQVRQEEIVDQELFIYIKEGKNTHKIYLKDIVYIESFRDTISIHLDQGDLVISYKISDIENKLPGNQFIRVHKSYIISISRIKSFNVHTISIGDKELPIGRTYKNEVIKSLGTDI